MAKMEVLHFGVHPDNPGGSGGILARSGGLSKEVVEEISRLCHGWSGGSGADLSHRALLSFPLKAALNSTPRGAYAAIRVTQTGRPRFQVLVMDRSDYKDFGYNPFALEEADGFPDWSPGHAPRSVEVVPTAGRLNIVPPPSPGDVGLVDEALHHLLASQKLYLPIAQPCAKSDRVLSLMIELLPDVMKQQLRFASFAPSPANGYHLAATATSGCDLSGWQRLMMTLVPGQLAPKLQDYMKKVRECLAYGDISSLRDQQRLLTLERGARPPTSPAPQPAPKIRAASVPSSSGPNRSPSVHAVRRPEVAVPRRSQRAERSGPRTAHWRGGRRQVPAPIVGLLLLALTVGSGWSYLEFFHQGGGLSWSDLVTPSFSEKPSDSARVPSLLEVVRVSEVYDRQIRGVKRAAMIPGLNLEGNGQDRLETLRQEAAQPLLAQIDMFRDLASAGIRQGARPDRERERLRALAHQGDILDVEWQRLVLAWHSLGGQIYWQDLARLSDAQVKARRDSLQEAAPQAHDAVVQELALGDRPRSLNYLRRQTRGMAQLMALFNEGGFSEEWATELYRAAESVSPSASPSTRAYRNSAFALVRLKRMEHGAGFGTGAFGENWQAGQWLPPAVRTILPDLRRAAGAFGQGEAPVLVADELSLYRWLEAGAEAVDQLVDGRLKMADLVANRAVSFDRDTYHPLLRRLNHEAIARRLLAGQETQDLAAKDAVAQVAEFEAARAGDQGPDGWYELAGVLEDPFLADWARRMVRSEQERQLQNLGQYETQWGQALAVVEKLRALARAGHDWSAEWRGLDAALQAGLAAGGAAPDVSAANQQRYRTMRGWRQQLRAAAPLELKRVTVRLDQGRQQEAGEAILEVRLLPDGAPVRSEPFLIGPAAPAGSGWVGTAGLDAPLEQVSATDAIELKIIRARDGQELLKVELPSLAAGGGPGALSRAQSGTGGTVQGQMAPGWWQALELAGPAGMPGI